MKTPKLFVLYILTILPAQGLTQNCVATISSTSPTRHYQTNNDGTVSDTKNNLMWMQCSAGEYRAARQIY